MNLGSLLGDRRIAVAKSPSILPELSGYNTGCMTQLQATFLPIPSALSKRLWIQSPLTGIQNFTTKFVSERQHFSSCVKSSSFSKYHKWKLTSFLPSLSISYDKNHSFTPNLSIYLLNPSTPRTQEWVENPYLSNLGD